MRNTTAPPPKPAYLSVGSRRQIAWALKVRARLLPDILELRRDLAGHLATSGVDEIAAARCHAGITAIDSVIRCQDARWWIDQRGHFAHSIVAGRAKAVGLGAGSAV